MQFADNNPAALGERRLRLQIAGEIIGLLSIVATGMAIAKWPSDPLSHSAFERLIDVPAELAVYLENFGVEFENSTSAILGHARMPVLALEICIWLLFWTGAGAALRARWVLFFGSQLLLMIPLFVVGMFAFAADLSKIVYILGAGRALIGRNYLLAGIIVIIAIVVLRFVPGLGIVHMPGESKATMFYSAPKESQIDSQDMLVAALNITPAELTESAAYVRAQIAYMTNRPQTVSEELRSLVPSNFSQGGFVQERLTVLTEFVDAHGGKFADNTIVKFMSAAIGFVGLLMVITATFFTGIAAILKHRLTRIALLRDKITEVNSASSCLG